MEVHVFELSDMAARFAAKNIASVVLNRPHSVLGLATGGTMLPVYENLRTFAARTDLSLAGIRSFNLDEYVGLAPDHPQSYWRFMREHFFDHINAPSGGLAVPYGYADDPAAEALRYDLEIRRAGGIDLQLLGIGTNGHIGFNEPGGSFDSVTRVVELAEETRRANARYFGPGEHVPTQAITLGIATILSAREILLLATGRSKAEAVRDMLEGPVTEACPASALRNHPNTTIVLDAASSSMLDSRTKIYTHGSLEELA